MSVLKAFDAKADWPEPDTRLINGGARPAPAFPIHHFGSLGAYLAKLAASKGAPVDYMALMALSAASGVIGAARSAALRDGWDEYTALWVLIVGEPSTNKTPPIVAVQKAISQIERDEAPDFDDRLSRHQDDVQIAKIEEEIWRDRVRKAAKDGLPAPERPDAARAPEEPERPRLLVSETTVEALAKLFAKNPRGLMLIRDELAAWLGNFGKYGGDGDAAYYLSTFNGVSTVVDRVKAGGSVLGERALLSIAGGIQPDRFSDLLMDNRSDDGLLSRFLVAWPDPAPVKWKAERADESLLLDILRRLRSLRMIVDERGGQPVLVPLSSDADALYGRWYEANTKAARSDSGLLAGFRGKGNGIAGRLALVLEMLDWAHSGQGKPPDTISAGSVRAATDLFDNYFVPMAARVYGDAARPKSERLGVALLREIVRRRARTFNLRDARRTWGVPGLSQADAAEAAAAVLVDGDCIRRATAPSAGPGRKPTDYIVNPWLTDA